MGEPSKLEVCEALVHSSSVFVHLDPRHSGVSVPTWLKTGPQLVLQLGFQMPIPIPDLELQDDGILATLSFQRSPFTCWLPWEAVFAVVGENGDGLMWPEDLPLEIAAEMTRDFAADDGGVLERILSGASEHNANPMHSPSEVRSSITARPLRLVGPAAPAAGPTAAPRVQERPSGIPMAAERTARHRMPKASHLRLVK